MFRWLLMVSTDNKPELTVSTADNIKAIFEEYGAELWLMFFLGMIAGIVLCVIYSKIKRYLKKMEEATIEINQECDLEKNQKSEIIELVFNKEEH